MTAWDWTYAWEITPRILGAMHVTLQATLLASFVALFAGLAIAVAKRARAAWLRVPVYWLTEMVRRTPLLIQLYFIFFALPRFGIVISPLVAGVIGLGLHNSAYMSEVYRAGINAIPTGQWEGARALNIPTWKIWMHVVLPQAIPIMIPALGNYINIIFKETALLSAISLVEIMGMARNIGNENYRYLEPITIVGLIYLSICLPTSFFLRWLEDSVNRRGSDHGQSAAAL